MRKPLSLVSSSLLLAGGLAAAGLAPLANAAEYQIDSGHSFIQFRTGHLGYSWLYGRFNDVKGSFSYDAENPEASAINVDIDVSTIDTNHAERDKHLRSDDFFGVDSKESIVTFKSTKYSGSADKGTVEGELSMNGMTQTISFDIEKIGEGDDPWGGYRAGFIGTYELSRDDFGIDYELGPAAKVVKLELGIEGIRQ